MRSFSLFLLVLLISSTVFSQIVISDGLNKEEATVVMKNGDVYKGFIYGFIDRRTISAQSEAFSSTDRKLNLTDKSFIYEDFSEKRQKLYSKDIKSVQREEDGKMVRYYEVGVEIVRGNGTERELSRRIWLPALREGAVKILGYRLMVGGTYSGTNIYYYRDGAENAIRIIDFGNTNLINLFSYYKRAEEASRKFFVDCPELTPFIDEIYDIKRLKSNWKVDRKTQKQELKDARKTPNSNKIAIKEKYFIKDYIAVYEEYNKICGE